jgi:hypothetical protein
MAADMALEHPAKDARNAGLHWKCNFCTTGLFAGRLKLGLTDRTGDHAGFVRHLHSGVLAFTATFLTAAVGADEQNGYRGGCRWSRHGCAQCLPRPKLAHGRSLKPYSVVNLKQRFHYGDTETFMFETSTG